MAVEIIKRFLPRKLKREIKIPISRLTRMVYSDAPSWLILTYFKLHYSHRVSLARSDMRIEQDSFRKYSERLMLDNDWFTGKIPTWLMAFKKQKYDKKSELKCLEIGSWQGLSAAFILRHFEAAQLTCVDTWEGADEHKSGHGATSHTLSKVENTFDANLSEYKDRLTKFKGTSFQYFTENFERDKFDLIYVDGSHHSDDVLVDAIKSFEMLKVNGLIIFDDYFWKYYPRMKDNPSGAINAFIRLKSYQLKVVCFDSQLIVRKTSSSARY